MKTLKKRDVLQEVLTKYGYSGWYLIEPSRLNPANCLLFNPKEKKIGKCQSPMSGSTTHAGTAQSENCSR
jgi:hypothetical protein